MEPVAVATGLRSQARPAAARAAGPNAAGHGQHWRNFRELPTPQKVHLHQAGQRMRLLEQALGKRRHQVGWAHRQGARPWELDQIGQRVAWPWLVTSAEVSAPLRKPLEQNRHSSSPRTSSNSVVRGGASSPLKCRVALDSKSDKYIFYGENSFFFCMSRQFLQHRLRDTFGPRRDQQKT